MRFSTRALGEIAEFRGGGTPSKARPEFYENGSIPWVTPKDMKSWRIDSAFDLITDEAVAQSTTQLIPPSSVLVVTRSGVLKHTLPVGINQIVVTINQDMKALVCSELVDPTYLGRFLKASSQQILTNVRGTTADNIPTVVLKNLAIPLPPLSEQKRIAAILDATDALRAKRREVLAQLDSLAQSVFLEMFGDPVTNPMGWELQPLGELGRLDRGVSKHRPRNEPSLLGGAHPLIQTGEVASSEGYIRTYTSTYSNLGLQQSKLWPAGTLCITIAANIANTGILTFDACFPDSVVGFRSDEPGQVEYVQGLFWFFKEILDRRAPQVAQKNINLKILRSLPVPVPPLHLQQRFATIVEAIERQKARYRAHLDELDGLFASLQSRAFNGEL